MWLVEVTQLVSGRIRIGQSQVYVLCCRSSSGSRKPAPLLEILHPGQKVAVMTDTCPARVMRGGTAELVFGHVDWNSSDREIDSHDSKTVISKKEHSGHESAPGETCHSHLAPEWHHQELLILAPADGEGAH